jgi:hypothetical protein
METVSNMVAEKPTETPIAPAENGDAKPKRERRPRKPKAAAEDGAETPAPKEGDADAAAVVTTPKEKVEKVDKPKKTGPPPKKEGDKVEGKPQYRKKVDTPAGAETKDEEGKDAKPQSLKKPRNNKPRVEKTTGEDGETPTGDKPDGDKPVGERKPKYKPKGEKTAGEDKTEGEDVEKKGPKEERKKKDEPKEEKNTVYRNPLDFVEKRKFKSKWEEYRHGDWRKGSGKTFVTLETEIPEAPAKTISLPDEAVFQKKQKEVEDRIKEISTSLEEKKSQFDETLNEKRSNLNTDDKGTVNSKDLGSKFAEMKILKEKRQAIYSA